MARNPKLRKKPADGDKLLPHPPAKRRDDGRAVWRLPVKLAGRNRAGALIVLEHPGTKETNLVLEVPDDMLIERDR